MEGSDVGSSSAPVVRTRARQRTSSTAQRRKAAGNVCIVCWQTPTDPAHLVDRSLAPDPYGDPLRVVALCRKHHEAYDQHALDLLPFLQAHRSELAKAVEVHPGGLLGALERITGRHWIPAGAWGEVDRVVAAERERDAARARLELA